MGKNQKHQSHHRSKILKSFQVHLNMFRNQYDSDVTTWSPQGRLHQVEYAMEAAKQGSATIGVKSKNHAVLLALKRASSELSAYQKKIMILDDHIGMTIAGLTADAKSISRWMRTECLSSRFYHNSALRLETLMCDLGNKMQNCIQLYNRRPYGVCPSANYYECKAMAIGARSQSARTYLEKHLDEFLDCDLEPLVAHGLRALRDTLPNEVDLSNKNVSIAIVGKEHPFKIYEDTEVDTYLKLISGEERGRGAAQAAAGEEGAQEEGSMETD